MSKKRTRINEDIRSKEVRLIGAEGENLGVVNTRDALKQASEADLDLIEISPGAKPPVAKIMDYGKYQYEQQKKAKDAKAKSTVTETKTVQIKIGTSPHDLELKARRANEWLSEGHRVKFELYLVGRAKYLDDNFLRERMERFLKLITTDYKIAQKMKKDPKGRSMILQRA